ncbi:acyl-CoA dehydrogenase [Brevundimonas denitrificans]|uniref:acyl-CoA dehydrogenase n=1 Tax=Brevundimonas denitrificans TaxID=1443434 RepID=UPI00223B6460|nr:acyl-CoA dehydrogenase [Brevundimonas denitrificans]
MLVVARIDGNDFDRDGLGLFVIDIGTPGLELAAYPTIDGRRACDITFALDVTDEAFLVEGAADALDLALDGATAGLCAEAVGVMRRILGETHAYLSERRQFGVPLATFQALQHQVADMLVALELSSGQAYAAANGLDATARERACAISAAKAFVGQAAHRMGQAAVQLHGGMGMTDELIIGHLFKRAIVIEAQFGSSDYHLNRYRMLKADARGRLH